METSSRRVILHRNERVLNEYMHLNHVLSNIMKINIGIIIILLIAVSVLYFIVHDSERFSKLTVTQSINSFDTSNIISKYKINMLKTDNEKIDSAINKKVNDYISNIVNKNDTNYTKISNAINFVEVTNEFKTNEVNRLTNSYICKITIISHNEEKNDKLYFNYTKNTNKEITIENVINKDKLSEFKTLLSEKYNLKDPNLSNFGLKKEYIEINNTDMSLTAKVKYDDIEDYITNQVLTSDNVTNYYTIFKDAIDPNKPMIALTFDDGPYNLTTERILRTLTQYHSKATFFVLGTRVDYYQDTIRKIVEQGSQIGNHTKNHLNLVNQSISTVQYEIDYVKQRVKEVANYDVTVMRPPYGNRNDVVKNAANCPLILWCVDTEDWKSRNASSVRQEALSGAFDGAIILMHDIYESTADAVEMIVPDLINRGYQLVTIDELFYYKGKEKVPGEVIYSIK